MENVAKITKRVFEFYAKLCPNARIAIHIASASYFHDGRVIRDGEFTVRVVVVDPKNPNTTVCVLAEKDGCSPCAALMRLFDSYDGPIFVALSRLGTVTTQHRDLVIVDLPKKGTREHSDHINDIESAISSIETLRKITNKDS